MSTTATGSSSSFGTGRLFHTLMDGLFGIQQILPTWWYSSSISSSMSTFPADHLLLQPLQSQQHITNTTITIQPQLHNHHHNLPNWGSEIYQLQLTLLIASLVWLILIPYLIWKTTSRTTTTTTTTTQKSKWNETKTVVTINTPTPSKKRGYVFVFLFYLIFVPLTIFITISGWISTMALINTFLSPYNTYTARRVFQTPLLTIEECQHIISISHIAAASNVRQLNKYHPDDFSEEEDLLMNAEPYGWQKLRHKKVPTTDLNVITDPYTYYDQQYIRQLCDVRIAPLLSRLYGIPIRSIQARDIFVVRYDGNLTRHKLSKHTDGGDISFTIYLNSDFTGGGTQFWNRHTKQPFHLLQSNVAGHLSTFSSLIEHEGYPTTEGQRYILVGFLGVVPYDDDGITPTGLSLYASWFNWNWMLARVVDYVDTYDWKDNKDWSKTTKKAIMKFVHMLDRVTSHVMTPSLITQEQLPEFIEVLETAYDPTNRANKARWIEDQQQKAFTQFIDDYFYEDDEEEKEEAIDTTPEEGDNVVVADTTTSSSGPTTAPQSEL